MCRKRHSIDDFGREFLERVHAAYTNGDRGEGLVTLREMKRVVARWEEEIEVCLAAALDLYYSRPYEH